MRRPTPHSPLAIPASAPVPRRVQALLGAARVRRHRFLAILTCAALLALSVEARAAVVCPGPSSEWGIDVSEFQGNINWNSVKAAGKSFAIIRVSDGTGHLDPFFAQNWQGAKAAGLIRGVYQFFEPGEDPVAQANLLLQHMGQIGEGDLPPMIDVEVTGGQSPATINSHIHKWIDTIQAATGRKPLIYTGAWFWNPDVQSGDFVSYPLVDSYYCNNCCPDIAAPWKTWTMWQYSSTGAVGGIGGHVDLDRFDGTLADLQDLAGSSVDWAASYVSQSWPLAAMPLDMVVNQSIGADIVMKNVGGKGWNGNTKLATTQPRDRKSVFAAPDWLSPDRLADCGGGAAPGANCKFSFTFKAPDTPGDYKEFFGMVQEGVAWFSDPGQGGPPDNQMEAWIHVAQADYHGEFTKQSYPLAPAPQMATAGQKLDGWIELKNVGNQTWKAGVTTLAPTPRDKPSPLAAPDWISPTRVSTLAQDVPPGQVGHFPLSLLPAAPGDETQTFSLVEEGVTWFADAPKGGGPPDDFLKVHVIVAAATPDLAMAPVADMSGPAVIADLAGPAAEDGATDDASPAPTDEMAAPADMSRRAPPDAATADGDTGDGGAPGTDVVAGCSCEIAARPSRAPSALGLLAIALLIGALRRRR